MGVFRAGLREKRLDRQYSVREDGVVLSDGFPLSPVRGEWVSLWGGEEERGVPGGEGLRAECGGEALRGA